MEQHSIEIIEEIVDDEMCEIDERIFLTLEAIAHDHMYLFSGPDPSYENKQSCTICGNTLSTFCALKKHMEDCHGEESFQCKICFKNFVHEQQLNKHQLCHSGPGTLECQVCQKMFVRPETLKRHMQVHSDLKPYKCMFCDREFKFRTPWKMHEATHTDDQPFECLECGVKFSLVATLKEHADEGNCTRAPFICIDCDIEFVRRMDYLRHLSEAHGGRLVQKDFSCSYCNKAFIYQSLLRVHERRHTGEEPYQCHQCGATFCQRYQLRSHHCLDLQENDTELILNCSYCPFQCTTKRTMGLHERHHHTSETVDLLHCQFCRKKFVQHDKWSKHVELCQEGAARTIPCPQCSMTFSSSTAQKIHQSRVHKEDIPVICQQHYDLGTHRKPCNMCHVCGKCFSEKSVLIKHYRVHTGERPYQCQFCGNRFTSPSALQNHERTHTGERPHRCSICGKSFVQRTSLVEHVRRHTKAMPHKCSLCDKGFMVPSLLKKHIQTHRKGSTS